MVEEHDWGVSGCNASPCGQQERADMIPGVLFGASVIWRCLAEPSHIPESK
jgi:hypothetical protein